MEGCEFPKKCDPQSGDHESWGIQASRPTPKLGNHVSGRGAGSGGSGFQGSDA